MSNQYYITTAIPYVNDRPHLGHALLFTYADVLARYQRQQGKRVILSIGTDEHGGKIEEKAKAAGIDVLDFATEVSSKFRTSADALGISYNRFIRTTDVAHEQRAQKIWQDLGNYIYRGQFHGWYCTGCEEYKTQTEVSDTNGICPNHDRAYEELQQENYFFKLSEFSDELKAKIESNQFRIVPESRRNEVLAVLHEGLQDISISRPVDSLSWGIPVPGDENQVMYVWFEALMNYITVLGYPEHKDFNDYWPANTQVIGKDILRFHALIWPAMLLGLGLELPNNLYAHGFVTSGGRKMSKTLGNVVDPLEVVDKYGLDAFRYYFLRHIPSYNDGDFSYDKFEAAYNGELANELGNAVSRVAAMIKKYRNGIVGDNLRSEVHDNQAYHAYIADYRFDKALELVWSHVSELNRYIEVEKPWQLANEDSEKLVEVLQYSANSLLEIALLLKPFLPQTAESIEATFGSGTISTDGKPLFPRI